MDTSEQNSEYIERLFPRCNPPKAKQPGQRRANTTRGRVYTHTRRERTSMSHHRHTNSSDSSDNDINHKNIKGSTKSLALHSSLSQHSALGNMNELNSQQSHSVISSLSTTSINNLQTVRPGSEILLASGKDNNTHQRNYNNDKVVERSSSSYTKRRHAHKRNHPIRHNNVQCTSSSSHTNLSNNISPTTILPTPSRNVDFSIKEQQQQSCQDMLNNNSIQQSYNSYETDLATSVQNHSQNENSMQINYEHQPHKTPKLSQVDGDLISSPKSSVTAIVTKSHSINVGLSGSREAENSSSEPHVVTYNYVDERTRASNDLLITNDNTNNEVSSLIETLDANSYDYDIKCSSGVITSSANLDKNVTNSPSNEAISPRNKYLHIFVYDDAKNSEEPIKLAVNRHDDSYDNIHSPTTEISFSELSPSSNNKELYDPTMGGVLSSISNSLKSNQPSLTVNSHNNQIECPPNHQQQVINSTVSINSGKLEVNDTVQFKESQSDERYNKNSKPSSYNACLSIQRNNKLDQQPNPSQVTTGELITNKLASRSVGPGYPQRVVTMQKSEVSSLPSTNTSTTNGSNHTHDSKYNLLSYSPHHHIEIERQVDTNHDPSRLHKQSQSLASQLTNLVDNSGSVNNLTESSKSASNFTINPTNDVYSITDLLHLSSLKDSEFDDASRDELNHHDILDDVLSLSESNDQLKDDKEHITISHNNQNTIDVIDNIDKFNDNRSQKYALNFCNHNPSSSGRTPTQGHQIDTTTYKHPTDQHPKEVLKSSDTARDYSLSQMHKSASSSSINSATKRLPPIIEEDKQIQQHSRSDEVQPTNPTLHISDQSLIDNEPISSKRDEVSQNLHQQIDASANQNLANSQPLLENHNSEQQDDRLTSIATKNSLVMHHERVNDFIPPSNNFGLSMGSVQHSNESSFNSAPSNRCKNLLDPGNNIESYKGPPLLSHFHCMSENDSGQDENEVSSINKTNNQHQILVHSYNPNDGIITNNDLISNNLSTNSGNSVAITNIGRQTQSTNQSFSNNEINQITDHQDHHINVVDDEDENDQEKIATSALMFPRLDEGLSSGAESVDDEPYDDDECADDADNDDDEDDNDVDDTDIDQLSLHNSSSRQDNLVSASKAQHQQNEFGKRRMSQHLQHHTNSSNANINSILDGSMNQMMRANGDFNEVIPSDGLPNWQSSQQPITSMQQPSTSHQQDHRESKPNQFSSDTDNETDRLLGTQRNDQLKLPSNNHITNDTQHQLGEKAKQSTNSREVLIEGVLFVVKYLGSTQLECDGQSSKQARVNQAEMAVFEVKNTAQDGEPQPHTEVQLFISTEKIMVLDHKHKKIMMDHSLRTISYIADIGEILVLMARRRNLSNDLNDSKTRRAAKMICHVFESDEAQLIAQSMNNAFQLAYMEFLKASGIEDTGFLSKEVDYQEVLNSQEMSTDELEMFANRKNQREVIVPKKKNEILGISIVESGWGSMLPTVVIANLKIDGPAYRCKNLAIGDQILSINGNSLVGLPLADCQEHIRKTKNQTVAKLSIVPCPITVEVKIRRPDTKYQLGFSVQNGVICSLLRGGIAERGGVRVGHRIMSINGTTVVGVPHEKIVTLLASSVGEIRMKTCLTSLYRLMLGQEHPVHF